MHPFHVLEDRTMRALLVSPHPHQSSLSDGQSCDASTCSKRPNTKLSSGLDRAGLIFAYNLARINHDYTGSVVHATQP